MKRPFFFFACFVAVLILIFHFFVKEERRSSGHMSNFVSGGARYLAVKGTIISDPFDRYSYYKRRQIFVVKPELVKVSKSWYFAYGNIRVTSFSNKELKYGDEILFETKLKLPFSDPDDSFDYKGYLERSGIYALATISERDPLIVTGRKAFPLKTFAYGLKDFLSQKIQCSFKAPEKHFLSAVLLGERQDIPEGWRDIFIKTQTMHLLAISGLHVGIIAFIMLFFIGLFGIPRNLRYIITILLLVFYAIMVGGRPSVVRATVMGVVILGSYVLKRNADIYNSLGLAAAAILMFNPDELFDYGFILSFVSVLSIVYMTPRINRALRVDNIKRYTRLGSVKYYFLSLATASFAVWLGLLPLNMNFFNIISPVSVFVNILAIPLLFVIIALSLSALIFYPIFSLLGLIFAEAAHFFIAILLSSLKFFSSLPLAYLEVKSTGISYVVLYYFALIIIFERNRLRQILAANSRKS